MRLVLWQLLICPFYAANITTLAPSTAPSTLAPSTQTRAPTLPPTFSGCVSCDPAVERCVVQQGGLSASCECIPGYRRDVGGVCVMSRDHIDMKDIPNQIPGKVSAETFEFEVTTMDSRDLWCELLSDPNTGHYKYGTASVSISGAVTKFPVTLTLELENHITEFVVLLSCYLTLPGQGYDSRQVLEIRTINVEGASGIYDQVDTDRLPKYLSPMSLPNSIIVSVAASAKGPRDLHLDLILDPSPTSNSQLAGGKISIAGVSPMQNYNFTLPLLVSLDDGATAFWSAYLTPPNLDYKNVVPNGWGQRVDVRVGGSPPTPPTPVFVNTSSPTIVATGSPTSGSTAPSMAPSTSQPSKQPTGGEQLAPSGEDAANGLGIGWIVLLVLVSLALVGGIGFFCWRKKRSQQSHLMANLNGDLEYSPVPY